MKVSIVTVVYNDHRVKTAIDSILSQDLVDELELVVIDGGSTDGTLEILKQFGPRITLLVSEPDNGIYDAMNKGLRLATGDVVGTLNADDFYSDSKVLSKVCKAMKTPFARACYGNLVYVDKDDTSVVKRFWQSCDYHDGLFEQGWMPPHPTFFVRRDVYEEFGYFNLSYTLAADFELTMRFLAKHHIPFVYIPHTLVTMRLGGATNVSLKNIIKNNRECIQALKDNGLRVAPFYLLRKAAGRISQFFVRSSAPDKVAS